MHEGVQHIHEHNDVDAEARHFSDEEHKVDPRQEDSDGTELPLPGLEKKTRWSENDNTPQPINQWMDTPLLGPCC